MPVGHRAREAATATRTIIALVDDIEGGPAQETLRFSLGGAEYEIGLADKNAVAFRRQLAPFAAHARTAGKEQRRHPARAASGRQRAGAIRAWAKEQGITVNERDRIPPSVADRYAAATAART